MKQSYIVLIGAVVFLSVSCNEEAKVVEEKAPHSDHGHDHSHDHSHGHSPGIGKNHGILAPYNSADGESGYLEVKLHDDKGDIELWMFTKKDGDTPTDFALETVPSITFKSLDNKVISLAPRDLTDNKDEN